MTPSAHHETAAPIEPETADGRRRAWTALALDLPALHTALEGGTTDPVRARLAALPPLVGADLSALDDGAARLAALDVLMVEAFVRRHHGALAGLRRDAVDAAARAVAERIDVPPILSYPLYIRENPTVLGELRRFTPLEAEFRFIRMHRLIEDELDRLLERLEGIVDAGDPPAALAEAHPALVAALRRINRTVAGFRGAERMPIHDFMDGFRPYFEGRVDPDTGETVLEGPSGLQSPTYRMLAMRLGYRDDALDGWTRAIAHHHEPAWRDKLARARDERDAGRALSTLADALWPPAAGLPHIHPDYAEHLPALEARALALGGLSHGVRGLLAARGARVGHWPDGVPRPADLPPAAPPPALDPSARATLGRLADLEALVQAFNLEHAASAAHHLGDVPGTGGTSGVEFLLLATFRRAFPALWHGGAGAVLPPPVA